MLSEKQTSETVQYLGWFILAYTGEMLTLLLLDIEMNAIDGIEVMKQLEYSEKIWRIVFVSHHSEQVFSTFGMKTLDFGKKPISYEKICHWLNVASKEAYEDSLIQFDQTNPETWFRISEIQYIQANGSYIQIYTRQTPITVSRNIKYWEKQLSVPQFARVHKSYIVNLEYVQKIDAAISLRDMEQEIPIGRKYYNDVTKKYNALIKKRIRVRME